MIRQSTRVRFNHEMRALLDTPSSLQVQSVAKEKLLSTQMPLWDTLFADDNTLLMEVWLSQALRFEQCDYFIFRHQ